MKIYLTDKDKQINAQNYIDQKLNSMYEEYENKQLKTDRELHIAQVKIMDLVKSL